MERLFNRDKSGNIWGDTEREIDRKVCKFISELIEEYKDIEPVDIGHVIHGATISEIAFASIGIQSDCRKYNEDS